MSANTRRAGSGRHEGRRTAGVPATASARLGRKAVAGLAGFGSAAALAGAGMAMLASPGSVSSATGPAHTAQPDVQKATLTAGVKSRATAPPQPTLPGSNGTDASDVNTPTPPLVNQLNPGSEANNPREGVVGTVTVPFSPDPGTLFGTPSASAAVKMDPPSTLFGNSAGGNEIFTATSPQAGMFVNNALGFLPIPSQQTFSVQGSRLPDGTLPFANSAPGLPAGVAAQQQDAATSAFNALFGQGGQLDTLLGNTQVPAPVPFSNFNPFDLTGGLNPAIGAANMGSQSFVSPATTSDVPPNQFAIGQPPFQPGAANLGQGSIDQSFSGLPDSGVLGGSSATTTNTGAVTDAGAGNVLGPAVDPAFQSAPSSGTLPPATDPAPAPLQQGMVTSDPSMTVAGGNGFSMAGGNSGGGGNGNSGGGAPTVSV